MDQSFKQQLLLSIIDKILFGLIILIISVVFNFYVEKKISEIDRREQRRYEKAEALRRKADEDVARLRRQQDEEDARRNQIRHSVSRINSDLVVEQRKGLTKWMGIYFMEVDRLAPQGQISREDVEKLKEITANIKKSIYQIDALSTDFSTNQRVRAFFDALIDCNLDLSSKKRFKKQKVLAELAKVRKTYTLLLAEIRRISIKLAQIDYDLAKPVVDSH
jgi:hypothetical protein